MNAPVIKDKVLVQNSTHAQALADKEPIIDAGAGSDYYRGDKTWQPLNKTAVGLANVDNVSDVDKPVSTAVATALGNKIDNTARGAVNGVASLDGTGKVPSAQLPSYVDDVVDVATKAALPAIGESSKIYLVIADESRSNSSEQYRWSGSTYTRIPTSPGSTDEVPEGATRFYFTENRVRSAILTGLSTVTNAAITAADSVLGAFGKLQKQINDLSAAVGNTETTIAVGTVAQYLRGDKTWSDFASDVRSAVLTGLSTATNAAISSADNVLGALGKLQKQITDLNTSVGEKEGTIAPGTTSQFYRGDKTWQTITKSTVGLSNVDDTSDTNKPISTAMSVALGNKVDTSAKGAANGVAALDATGKVPSAQLPSYVDDVIEVATKAALPGVGESSKIYLVLADETRNNSTEQYRWSGSVFTRIPTSPGSTDEVPEGASRLYFTESRVRAAILTGLTTVTNAAISAGDSVLSAFGKLQKQITDLTSTVGGKENSITAGSDQQYFSGDKTWQNLAGAVRSTALVGLSTVTNAVIAATDSVLSALGKLQTQITDMGITKNTGIGSINVSGVSGGYAGVTFTGVAADGTLRDNGTTHSYHREGVGDLWTCDNTGLFLAKNDIGSASDETLKMNWQAMHSDFISRLAKVKHGIYDRIDIEATQVGVSAQSVLAEVPDFKYAVHEGPDGKLTVAYANAALVSSVELAIDAVRKDELIAQQAMLIQKLTDRVVALENKSA